VVPRWAIVPVLAAAGVGVWVAARSHPWEPPSHQVTFSTCRFSGGVTARCAQVVVPKDPEHAHDGSVSLRVAVLPATRQPAKGALFYLEGGPGASAIDSISQVAGLFAQIGRDRDVVLVDQRGTDGSHRLACPGERVPAADADAVTAYLRRCFAQLPADVTLDSTGVAADDLDAVRRALGYHHIDLYGVSYGATLAQAFLAQHGSSVRTATLDSGSLPGVRVFQAEPRNAERALARVFGRCARVPACHRAYPDPRRDLAAVLVRGPRGVTVETGHVVLTADDVAETVAALTQSPDAAATLPYVVHAAARGDYTALARAFVGEIGSRLDPRARLGMVWVELCSEQWASLDPAATAHAGRGSYFVQAAVDRARVFARACRVVPKEQEPARFDRSDRPVLLLAGTADPLDPPENVRGYRRLYPNGRLVVVAGGGHGQLDSPCVASLVARFVAAGTASGLDAACVRRRPSVPFAIG
jgi:pimeloyl-ACP methyl ester carboxylesterase